jgi:hypothetical protein
VRPGRLRIAAALVVVATMTGGAPAGAVPPTVPPTVPSPAGGEVARPGGPTAGRDASSTAVAVPLPDLGLSIRRPDGGINLFRMPLSELEEGFGVPQLVRGLSGTSGFSFDRSRVLTGDFGDITAGDDGSADHVIWLALPDGGVRVWAVGGGSDTVPRSVHVLRAATGWSWANTRPMVGDVDGDGWDDLVVRLKASSARANVFVLRSDGQRLGAPELWLREDISTYGFDGNRYLLADLHADGRLDYVWLLPTPPRDGFISWYRWSTGTSFSAPSGPFWLTQGNGWSYAGSRQLAGDVDGDGLTDLVSIKNVTDVPGLWVQASDASPIALWQHLSTGGWSWSRSRQYLADTDGDGLLDVVHVHRSGDGGLRIWRSVSAGTRFYAPEPVATLAARSGWNWSTTREGVANTFGVLVE